MHNWRLLLLAFVAVFQPIASFTQRVDGRQRCDYRAASLLQDPGVHFHGTYRFTKPAVDRRLNQREDVRSIRHEVRGESLRTPLQNRLANGFEKIDRIVPSLGRLSRTEYHLTRDAAVLSRKTRDERNAEIRRARQTSFDSRLSLYDDERQISNRRFSARMESQSNRQNMEERRAREVRNTIIASDRVRDDATDFIRNARRIARERKPRMDVSSERMQPERSVNREMNRAAEVRGSLMTGGRVNRAGSSLDQNERQSTRSQRSLDNESLQRTRDSRDSIRRERLFDEQRRVRDLSARTRDVRTDESYENRRDFSYRDAGFRGQRLAEAQRETRNNERDTRLTRAIRLEENRVSRNSENFIETRKGENIIRNMERDYKTTERTVENRRNVRSRDHENQRDLRNSVQDLREIKLDRERITEVRGESRHVNRQSWSLDNERNAERWSSERVNRFLTEREAQNQRSSRISRIQRDAENERATREVRRESPLDIRMDFANTRSVEKEHSQEVNRREIRNSESRIITAEHDDRRNNERQSRSFDRLVDSQRDAREGSRNDRILRQKRSSETRESERIFRVRDLPEENRRSIQSVARQSRITRDERTTANRRAIRTAEIDSRSNRRESSVKSGRDIQKLVMGNRRTARYTEKDSRTIRGEEMRIARARDSLSMDRKSFRGTDPLTTRGTNVNSRRSRSIQDSRRVAENNMDHERGVAGTRFITKMTRKRDLLTATGNENETFKMNWQYLFYTLQGLYFCGILTQLMNEKKADMKTRSLYWWSAPQNLIKVD